MRLIEAPKPCLKAAQRKILSGILERIPANPAVHGFLKGHSIKTFVAPHVAQRVVVRLDLQNFFPGHPRATPGIRRSSAHESKLCSAPWASPKPLPISSAAAAPVRLQTASGQAREAKSRRATWSTTPPSAARRAHFARARESLRPSPRLPSRRPRAISRRQPHPLRRRPCLLGRCRLRPARRTLLDSRRGDCRRRRLRRPPSQDAHHASGGPAAVTQDSDRSRRIAMDTPNFRRHLEGRVGFVETIHAAKGAKLRAVLETIRWD